MRYAELPEASELNRLFFYNKETGTLTNKARRCGTKVGAVAGNTNSKGYTRIKIKGRLYLAHRIIFKMINGSDPGDQEIDHINGNPSDNRVENLRIASHGQNQQNTPVFKNNKLKIRGVHFHKQHRKYCAAIQKDGKRFHLGLFICEKEAAKAYNDAAINLHRQFAKLNNVG